MMLPVPYVDVPKTSLWKNRQRASWPCLLSLCRCLMVCMCPFCLADHREITCAGVEAEGGTSTFVPVLALWVVSA